MHRITTIPGGWNPQSEGVIFIEQTPAPIIFLTTADTDIQTISLAKSRLNSNFPPLRVTNILQLQQQLTIDTYAEDVLRHAKVIIVRLLGGRSYWSYGLEILQEIAENYPIHLMVMPGDDQPDPDLIRDSNVSLSHVNRLWRYFTEGGVNNFINGLKWVSDLYFQTNYQPEFPQSVPTIGAYEIPTHHISNLSKKRIGILFYRAHYLSGNLVPIENLCQVLIHKNLTPVPIFVSSLRERDILDELMLYFYPSDLEKIHLLINTTSFAVSGFQGSGKENHYFEKLNIPVLQAIFSSGTLEQWEKDFQGLSPRDVAMNIALPEVDGKIITTAISFKSVQTWNEDLQTDVVGYQPLENRLKFLADLTANFIRLQNTSNSEKRIALILANYPNRDGRLANGVGLDTPQSCVEILQALHQENYQIDRIPENGDQLIQWLTKGITNDPESRELRQIYQYLDGADYQKYFNTLPPKIQEQILQRWGEMTDTKIPIAGIQLGNIFVGIQPSRGYDLDPSLNYHAPDLEPTHHYLAFYYWLNQHFQIHAIIHVGKHGNLEWLPGKSVSLSSECYPEITLGSLPHFYPFIINDPGEGSQAKRRAHAVILDHLTPPMTRAQLYGSLQQLESLIDEYYEAQSLDPSRLKNITERILLLIRQEHLDQDLGLSKNDSNLRDFINQADGYLCELKEAQIRDGLHIFGHCPQGEQLRDLIMAISRHPRYNYLGLTRALAQDFQLDFDPLTTDPTLVIGEKKVGKLIEQLENKAASFIDKIINNQNLDSEKIGKLTRKELTWIQTTLHPLLLRTQEEISHLLRGLRGEYVPSGASGAPTRGRPDVLPTGRNFYSVDIRAIPTETAYQVGQLAAERLIERYTQEQGEYPRTLGLSVWGTSTMRTGGDDIAQALALLGVKPIWEGSSRRVIDFEILPLSLLRRPRVDVTLRISGFFRDAFPNLIDLFDSAVKAVSRLNEPPESNPLAFHVQEETQFWRQKGLPETTAKHRSLYRIFGSKPGAYGAGLQGLIEAQNWQDDQDLAKAYIQWGSYAYGGKKIANEETEKSQLWGHSEPEALAHRLSQLQIVLQNQDNREHDLLDSDDYYQFQGGMTAAIRALTGKNPITYFGDHSLPENPKIKSLREEIAKVYRSRVINPKWIKGVMRHGYKGAFEMAATVDYLFAYDATTHCVEDFMYQGIAENYLFDPEIQQFIQAKNPWALRDMAERLLEANQRGLWQNVDLKILDQLREIALQAEGDIETKTTFYP